jgi:hypothetical protein
VGISNLWEGSVWLCRVWKIFMDRLRKMKRWLTIRRLLTSNCNKVQWMVLKKRWRCLWLWISLKFRKTTIFLSRKSTFMIRLSRKIKPFWIWTMT